MRFGHGQYALWGGRTYPPSRGISVFKSAFLLLDVISFFSILPQLPPVPETPPRTPCLIHWVSGMDRRPASLATIWG